MTTPTAASPAVSRSMRSNRSTDTTPELRLRSALHRRGRRFRKHRRPVPGLRCTADIVFPRHRVAVFVDGCFWHCCPTHGTRPVRNGDWWAAKLDRNVERDRRNDRHLTEHGWTVLRVWEHEDTDVAVTRIITALDDHGTPTTS